MRLYRHRQLLKVLHPKQTTQQYYIVRSLMLALHPWSFRRAYALVEKHSCKETEVHLAYSVWRKKRPSATLFPHFLFRFHPPEHRSSFVASNDNLTNLDMICGEYLQAPTARGAPSYSLDLKRLNAMRLAQKY